MSQYDPSFVVGLSSDEKEELRVAGEKQKMNSAVCGGHVYKRGFFMPHSSHTEARILETIAANPPADTTNGFGKVVFGIDWPGGPNKGMSSKSPCPECQALICAALACFDIVVCDEENEPIDQSEECDE